MTQYLLSVHSVQGQDLPSDAVMGQMYRDVDAFNKKLQAEDSWVFAGGLQPAETAVVVRSEGGRTSSTNGPLGDAKERISGFWVITAADLGAALAWAAQASQACQAPVEVRPFQEE